MATISRDNPEIVRETALKLLDYCRANDWAGYDPYDALNSRVFRALPFLDFKAARPILTQAVKRSPVNLRPLLAVPKSQNPKGIALFLSSLVKLTRSRVVDEGPSVSRLAERLLAMRSPGQPYSCWGYSFDWQTRAELVPKGSPNIICSTFAGNALLDAHEQSPKTSRLEAAGSAADFLLDVLFWKDGGKACFSYTPLGRDEIHNANLLGAAFLCRVGRLTGKSRYIDPALEAARYSVSRQRADGSWPYGEGPHQGWIDNFHTGYNLSALRRIGQDAATAEFESAVMRGFAFYRSHFFREDGAPKYYHDAVYPIDIHSVAQSVLTLVEFEHLGTTSTDLASAVFHWAMANMWDERGYFYFQKHPHWTMRTPFMRWSQAWMLLALATRLDAGERPS